LGRVGEVWGVGGEGLRGRTGGGEGRVWGGGLGVGEGWGLGGGTPSRCRCEACSCAASQCPDLKPPNPTPPTSVAFVKDTTIRPSRSSPGARRSVKTAVGCPGRGDTASSDTDSPGRSTLSVERGPLGGGDG
jgi:hypothetical protein